MVLLKNYFSLWRDLIQHIVVENGLDLPYRKRPNSGFNKSTVKQRKEAGIWSYRKVLKISNNYLVQGWQTDVKLHDNFCLIPAMGRQRLGTHIPVTSHSLTILKFSSSIKWEGREKYVSLNYNNQEKICTRH